MKYRLIAIFCAAFCYLSCSFAAADEKHPFSPGEKLHFKLRWGIIPAGEAFLEVSPFTRVDGIEAYHFILTARSTPFIDLFYKVRDRIEAYTDLKMTRSLLYKKRQREGRHERDIVVNFDWHKNEARYSNFNKARQPIALPRAAFDPLSAFYHVRLLDLKENMRISYPVTDGKKFVLGDASVVAKETITVAGISYETYLVEPDLKDVRGVFRKSKGAKIQIWLTADERRIPVRLKSKVVVGSFVGELVSISSGPLQAARH